MTNKQVVARGGEQDPHVAQTGIRDSSRFTGLGKKTQKSRGINREHRNQTAAATNRQRESEGRGLYKPRAPGERSWTNEGHR